MSSSASTTARGAAAGATGMVPIPPALFALAATAQRLAARGKKRRKRRRAEEPERPGSGSGEDRHPGARRHRCPGGRRMLSIGVAGASVALLVAGASEMSEAGTSLDARTPAEASALVTSGVFARTRNPLYLGLAGLLTAHALWLGSKRALLPAGMFVLIIDRYQVPAEEAALTQKFGRAYRAYTETVPRWLLR